MWLLLGDFQSLSSSCFFWFFFLIFYPEFIVVICRTIGQVEAAPSYYIEAELLTANLKSTLSTHIFSYSFIHSFHSVDTEFFRLNNDSGIRVKY